MSKVAPQRRRLLRRMRQHEAWITFDRGVQSYECQVLNISADGAKLVTGVAAPVGTTFRLSTVPQALVRRSCEVIWRRGRTIGVKFTTEDTKTA